MIYLVKLHFVFRFIQSKNRAGLSFTLAVNHLADRTRQELKMMNGYRYKSGYNGGLPFEQDVYNMKNVPDTLDWRLYGNAFCSDLFNICNGPQIVYVHMYTRENGWQNPTK